MSDEQMHTVFIEMCVGSLAIGSINFKWYLETVLHYELIVINYPWDERFMNVE